MNKDKERQRKQIDVWQQNNSEKKLSYNRIYSKKIRDKRKNDKELDELLKKRNNDYQKKWYLGNKDKANANKNRWREVNPCKNSYYKNKRRARKNNADGSHTIGEWENLKAQYNWTCPCCKKEEPKIILSRDHIIPLSRGGSDNIENIQPLCFSCNSRKYTKTIKY